MSIANNSEQVKSPLYLYNQLSRQKELFVSIEEKRVKMYCCGPTVYGFLHVGNFRGAVVFNFLRNWLEFLGYQVTFVYNFTDVDDKILNKAQEEGVPAQEVSERYIQEFKKDFSSLRLKAHEFNPKVSENIEPIIEIIRDLMQSGHAYLSTSGDVLYRVSSFADYGKLSGRVAEELLSGARVEVDEAKESPQDFALWKSSKAGEVFWDSPWGPGRPGWHIECSAMIRNILGDEIDIHGGGSDLIFPHHENEIAQSEACTHRPLARYWLHNNMFTFSGQKMSKSLGNLLTMRDFLKSYPAEIYKFLTLSVHYRSLAEFSEETIQQSIRSVARVYSALLAAEKLISEFNQGLGAGKQKEVDSLPRVTGSQLVAPEKKLTWIEDFKTLLQAKREEVFAAFCDDLATPRAFAALFEGVREFNQLLPKLRALKSPEIVAAAMAFIGFIKEFGGFMSLFQEEARSFLVALDDLLLQQMKLNRREVDALVQERIQLRKSKNYAEADQLRKKLESMGILVFDQTQDTTWEVAK